MKKIAKITSLMLVLALTTGVALTFVGCTSTSNNPNLSRITFREQRAPSVGFYKLGSAENTRDYPETTHGHFGTQSNNAVVVNRSEDKITVNTSPYATQVAVNVRNMFNNFDNLTTLRIRTAAINGTAAGNWVDLRSTDANGYTTEGEHFHNYENNGRGVDAGWANNHKPAYFIVGTPVQGESRTIEINGEHNGRDFTITLVINRAQS